MMDTRRIQFILLAVIVLLAGCRPAKSTQSPPSAPPPAHPTATPPALQTVARIHWLGLNQLSRKTDAAALMAVWNLPASGKLQQQTLNKLSLAPWAWWHRPPDTNAAARLQPLLADVLSNECALEIRGATHQPGELAFAIRLDRRRADLWQTNLAAVLESLTGIHPVPAPDHHGWSLKKHDAPDLIELTRAGDWTIVGAAQDQNPLVAGLKSRIQHGQPPVAVGNSNDWLAADFAPAHLIPRLGTWNLELGTWNHLYLSVTGDGTNVLTRARADFSHPLALDLPSWKIPASLMDEHLVSFTLVRGFKPWLESSKAWTRLQIGPPPDQACFWALPKLLMQSYFAAPLPDPSNAVDRITDRVLAKQHHWFATNFPMRFERARKFDGLKWGGVPYMSPFLRSIIINHQNYVYGGGFPDANIHVLSLAPLQKTLSRTNLVYHDWEITGPRIEQWIYMGQFARLVLRKAQLPSASPALLWLKAIAPRLGPSVTDIARTGPDQLTFSRRSTLGFTAVELNLLADWLESPQFPVGLHTLKAPPPP